MLLLLLCCCRCSGNTTFPVIVTVSTVQELRYIKIQLGYKDQSFNKVIAIKNEFKPVFWFHMVYYIFKITAIARL